MLYKVLVVDDDITIRKSIIARISWQEKGMKVVGEGDNGLDAIKKVSNLMPDIVITDIRMPYKDGLSIMQEARKIVPHIQFIIISGYDDFEYTKKALVNHAANYLLKPIDDDELEQSLDMVKKVLIQSKTDKTWLKQLQINKIFSSYFSGESTKETFFNSLKKQEIIFNNSKYFMFCLNIFNNDISLFTKQHALSLQNIIEKYFMHSQTYMVYFKENIIYGLVNCNSDNISKLSFYRCYENCEQFLQNVSNSLDTKIIIGCSPVYDNPKIKNMFLDCTESLYCRFTSSIKEPIYYYIVPTQKHPSANTLALEELNMALKLGKIKSFSRLVKQLFINDSHEFTVPYLKYTLSKLLHIMMDYEVEEQSFCQNEFKHLTNPYFLLKFESLDSFIEYITQCLIALCSSSCTNSDQVLIENILNYINEHYNSPLSIAELSCIFQVHPIKLGQLFKKEIGVSFNKYLNELRVEKAKQIIQNRNDVKFCDMAYIVGFKDAYYFSKVFKQVNGLTPSEYKSSIEKK